MYKNLIFNFYNLEDDFILKYIGTSYECKKMQKRHFEGGLNPENPLEYGDCSSTVTRSHSHSRPATIYYN